MTPLPASLTIAKLGQPGAELRAVEALLAGANGGPVVVDAATLENFDSSAIALLLEAHRQARATGRSFAVHGAPSAMIELATLYGVADLLGLVPAAGSMPAQAPG
jgi:phospholipid transport system transporter-binding protein